MEVLEEVMEEWEDFQQVQNQIIINYVYNYRVNRFMIIHSIQYYQVVVVVELHMEIFLKK